MNTDKQTRQLMDAAAFSWIIAKPVNFFVTISLRKTGVSLHAPFRKVILKQLGDWCRKNIAPSPLYIWQMENPLYFDKDDRRLGGLNMHLLVHVPQGLGASLAKALPKWIVFAGGKMQRQVLDVKFLDGVQEPFDERFTRSLLRTTRYLVKGSGPAICAELAIEFEDQRDQGKIVGKRCGYSEGLGRRRWSFPSMRTSRPGISVAGQESRRRRILGLMGYDIQAKHPTRLIDA